MFSPTEDKAAIKQQGGGQEESIKVLIRVRPFNSRELQLHEEKNASKGEYEKEPLRSVIEFEGNVCHFLDPTDNWQEKEQFQFDSCIWSIPDEQLKGNNPFMGQVEMLHYGEEVLQVAWSGYNTCFFAYGQTGSGKTYSTLGVLEAASTEMTEEEYLANAGLIPRICNTIFKQIEERLKIAQDNPEYVRSFRVSVQYLEVYNEQIKDLLCSMSELPPDQKEKTNFDNLRVRYTPATGVFIENLTTVTVSDWKEMIDILDIGNNSRTVAATKMNERSSRSHALFKIILTQITTQIPKEQFAKPKEKIREAHINLVDLAGSERNKKTQAEGMRLKEAANINKSLFALKTVIDTLVDNCTKKGPKKAVPFRTSRLTELLMDSLGGNCRTYMLIAASPHEDNAEETLQTLRYGSRARKIVTVVHVNESNADGMMVDLEKQLQKMKEDVGKMEDEGAKKLEMEELRASVEKHQETLNGLKTQMKEQETKVKKLQRDRDIMTKHRNFVALARMERLKSIAEEKDQTAEAAQVLFDRLSELSNDNLSVEQRKSQVLTEIEEAQRRTRELEAATIATEAESDSLRKKVNKLDTMRVEAQRQLDLYDEQLVERGQDRMNYIMMFRAQTVKNKFTHAERKADFIAECKQKVTNEKQKLKRRKEDIQRKQEEMIAEIDKNRETKLTELSALKSELDRVEIEREEQITRMTERVSALKADIKKRKEAMATRIATLATTHEKKYNAMVATMDKQYAELMDECTRLHDAERKAAAERLEEQRSQHVKEIEEREAEWKKRIDEEIIRGKNKFKDNSVRWDRQLHERQEIMNDLRRKLRAVAAREAMLGQFYYKVAGALEKSCKPKSTNGRKFYDLLEFYYGQFEENRSNRTLLESYLKNDVNEWRCADPPEIGRDLLPDDEGLNADKKELLRNPSVYRMKPDHNTLRPVARRSDSPGRAPSVSPPRSTLFFPYKEPIRTGTV